MNGDPAILSFGPQLRGEPRLDSAAVHTPARPALRTVPAGDFVGREAELATLRAVCHAALHGERRIALIGGPPGVGKTRTAMELAREAEGLGFETWIGRTHGGPEAPPFWPWAQIVRGWALRHGSERLAELAGPGARSEGELLGLAAQSSLDPDAGALFARAQPRTLERARRFLERAARERPQLLILDDLHRADPASLELLRFLAQHPGQARLLVLATHRPLDPGHALGRVLQEPDTCSLALRGLERGAIEQVLARGLGRPPAPADVEGVHARSGGNPLFVYELARALACGEALRATLPPRIRDALRARVGECSPACLRVLCLASVAQDELTLPLLHEALGAELGSAELLEALEEAQRRDLLACSSGAYRFVHGIVRDALRAKLAPTERTQLLGQLDDALHALRGRARGAHSGSV